MYPHDMIRVWNVRQCTSRVKSILNYLSVERLQCS